MCGKIVQKLSRPLFGEFCCNCSVSCNGVEGFEGSVVYCSSIEEDGAYNLLEALFTFSSSESDILVGGNSCNLRPNIGGGVDVVSIVVILGSGD